MLPEVKRITQEAVQSADAVRLRAKLINTTDRQDIEEALSVVVYDWSNKISDLGVTVKGVWLVDFDTGTGYYCWKHPEEVLEYFHTYEAGFGGRMQLA